MGQLIAGTPVRNYEPEWFRTLGNKWTEGRSSDERPGYDSKEQSMLEQIVELRQNEENAKKRSNAKTARSKSGMQEQTERKLERERMWETKKKAFLECGFLKSTGKTKRNRRET